MQLQAAIFKAYDIRGVVPDALVGDGYRFVHPDLETALRALLKK